MSCCLHHRQNVKNQACRMFPQRNPKMSCRVDIGTVERADVTLTSTFRWKITNFSDFNGGLGSSLISPVFTTADLSVKWHLKLYPHGKLEKESDHLSISVYYCSEIESDASYEISIEDADNESVESTVQRKDLKLMADFESQSEAWIPFRSYTKFAERSFVENPRNRVLTKDCLTVLFEVTLRDPSMPNPRNNVEDHLKEDRLCEFDDFEKLLNNEEFSDVTLIVGDEKIQAHKAILSARSSVFKEMFNRDANDDDERKSVVEIDNLKCPVLMELCRFLYTGAVNNIHLLVDDLFAAAQEYRVKGLKTLCDKTLCGNLQVENALELYTIADNRGAKRLKERALEFIAERADEIVELDEFASLRPDLMREIVRVMARKKVNTEDSQNQ